MQDLPSSDEDDAEVSQLLSKWSSKSKKKKLSLPLRKHTIDLCSSGGNSKQGSDAREFDTQNESEVLPVKTGDDAKPSSFVENAADTSVVVDDYSVFHSYREVSDAVTAYEIETISKFNVKNKYKGFDVDIYLENYLSTISCGRHQSVLEYQLQ